MEQAEKLCDHIALVARGRVVLTGGLAELKRQRGANSWRLVATGDFERLRALPGVREVVEVSTDGSHRLVAEEGADGAALLRQMVGFLEVREFRSAEPTLEEIFVTAVNASEIEHAQSEAEHAHV
jgi:ABC-2 type transport system ATP-binding protein